MKKEQHDPGPWELGEKSLGVLQHRVRVERMGSPRGRGDTCRGPGIACFSLS